MDAPGGFFWHFEDREALLEELLDNWEQRVVGDVIAQIESDERDVEARSILAFSLFIGSNFIAAEHPGMSRAQVLQLALDRLLTESWG